MTRPKISSMFNVIKRPNNTFEEICKNPNYYFKPSVIILILASFFMMTMPFFSENGSQFQTNELGYILDAEMQIFDSVIDILGGFLTVGLLFYVGKKFGGSENFRRIFSVYSYSLIPLLIGGIISSIFLYYPPLLELVSGIDSEDPGFVTFYWTLSIGIFFSSGIWSFLLSIKAVKIGNNFGTQKALGLIFLVAIISYVILITILQLAPIDHPYFELIQNR